MSRRALSTMNRQALAASSTTASTSMAAWQASSSKAAARQTVRPQFGRLQASTWAFSIPRCCTPCHASASTSSSTFSPSCLPASALSTRLASLRKQSPSCRRLHTSSYSLQQQAQTQATKPSSIEQPPLSRKSEKGRQAQEEQDKDDSGRIPKAVSDVSLGEVRRLTSLARPEKKTLGIALGLLTVSSAVSLSVPFTLGKIIDLFTAPDSTSLPFSLPVAAALLGTVFAIGAAANTGRSILMRISGQRIVQRLRTDAYENTLKLDMAKFDLMGANLTPTGDEMVKKETMNLNEGEGSKKGEKESLQEVGKETASSSTTQKKSTFAASMSLSATSETTPDVGVRGVGDIISRLGSDSSIVGESLTRELSEGLRALATVVVGVGMMFYISAKLTAVMLCIVPPTAIGAVFYGRYLKKLSRRTQKKVGEMIAIAEERLSAVRTVQAFNAVSPLETQRFGKKTNEILDLAKKEAYASGLFFGGAGFSGNITMLALLSYGGKLVSTGEITVGDLSSLMLYTAYVGSSLVGLTSFFSSIMKGLGAAARCFELLDAQPTSVRLSEGIKLPADAPPRSLTFNNVQFSYPSRPEAPILRGVDLTLASGASVAIAGGSGSGKSTIVNLLERYYDPTGGRITYGDDDVRDFTPESWRARVSIVPQDPALFSQTIAENIAYGKPDATMSEIREAASLANCTEFIEDLPKGFDTPVGAKAAQLSGGQRQRLAIARALVRKPSILILDEATSALDAASETLVNQAVRRISSTQSITTILVAHRLSTLKTADEIIFMQDGKVAERGTYDELAREGTQFWNMIRTQMLGVGTGTGTTSSHSSQGMDDKEVEAEAAKA